MTQRSARGGLTLLEVILSLAILGGAVAVIAQAAWSGLENARMTRELVQAELLAENVMAELQLGIRSLESLQDEPFEEDEGQDSADAWVYSIDVAATDIEGLSEVRVTVRIDSEKPRNTSYSLVRWVADGGSEQKVDDR